MGYMASLEKLHLLDLSELPSLRHVFRAFTPAHLDALHDSRLLSQHGNLSGEIGPRWSWGKMDNSQRCLVNT